MLKFFTFYEFGASKAPTLAISNLSTSKITKRMRQPEIRKAAMPRSKSHRDLL